MDHFAATKKTCLYLGAQMELEGVLRLQSCLLDAIETLELIWSENIPSL